MSKIRTPAIDDTRSGTKEVQEPSWSEVEAQIDLLDGKARSMVGLIMGEDYNLVVGGGPGGYVVSFQRNGEIRSLLNPSGDEGLSVDVLCGQTSDYPGDEVVTKRQALQAARAFFDRGEADPRGSWRDYLP